MWQSRGIVVPGDSSVERSILEGLCSGFYEKFIGEVQDELSFIFAHNLNLSTSCKQARKL